MVPEPAPEAPLAICAQFASLEAIHAHPEGARTL
jgi:hypothetical protein